MRKLHLDEKLKRLGAGFDGIHQEKHILGILLVLDALAEGEDGHREFIDKATIAGIFMVFVTSAGLAVIVVWLMVLATATGVTVFVMCRGDCTRGCCGPPLLTDDTEFLSLDFKKRTSAGFAGLFEHFTPFEEVFSHYFIFFAHCHVFTVGLIFNLYMPVTHINYRYTGRCSHAKP